DAGVAARAVGDVGDARPVPSQEGVDPEWRLRAHVAAVVPFKRAAVLCGPMPSLPARRWVVVMLALTGCGGQAPPPQTGGQQPAGQQAVAQQPPAQPQSSSDYYAEPPA